MKNGKHTPGPWQIERYQDAISTIGPIGSFSIENVSWLEVSEDDARLIAAAPDLLEALKRLLDENDEFLTLQGRINLARAAIAKAEGAEA